MTGLDFRVLGPLEVWREGERVVIPAPKQRALLGLLLLRANQPVHQAELIDQLWGEEAPPTARASLQNLVHALRTRLGADRLERQPEGYVLRVASGELDLDRFQRLVIDAQTVEPRERVANLRAALMLWRGAPLVEMPAEPFVQHELVRLEDARLGALEDLMDTEIDLGERADLIVELESLVDRYPHRERIWGQLMLALYRDGRQFDALETYRRARAVLIDHLGVEPGEGLRELQREILTHSPALDDREHRLGWTLERAAAVLPWAPEDRAESLYEFGLALMRTGEVRRAVSTMEAAARTAATAGEHGVEERARLYLSYMAAWSKGKSLVDHLTEAEHASQRFEEQHDPKGLLTALRHRYQFQQLLGRADEAAELALYAAHVAAESGEEWFHGACLSERAWLVACGSTPVDEAIAECEELCEPGNVASGRLHLSAALILLYAQAGRIDEARACGERAVEQARGGLLGLLPVAFSWRSQAERIVGNVADALAYASSAYAIPDSVNDPLTATQFGAELACLLALNGDLVRARELALSARASTSPEFFETEVNWRRALALVAAKEGRGRDAITLSDEARAQAGASDMLTFRGQVLEDAATVHRLAGDAKGEADALEEAFALYEQKRNVVGAERVRTALQDNSR